MFRTIYSLLCSVSICFLNQISIADDSIVTEPKTQIKKIGDSGLQIMLSESSDSATFAIRGLSNLALLSKLPPEELSNYFTIRVQYSGATQNPTPLLGSYSISDSDLRFTSRFPLSPSVQYRVELSQQFAGLKLRSEPILFSSAPERRLSAATVSAIYPSAEVLPENVLKFYIHFSAPMSRGEAYQRIHLMQDDTVIDSPFLELGEELWDKDQTRFTLFVHPGRIKRGLKPREESGTPMVDGNTYRLLIDADWLGADRQPLAKPFEKRFRVSGADSRQPDNENWKVVSPIANSKQPVRLTFDEPLDHAMLSRVVSVRNSSNAIVHGQSSISLNETVWSFIPTEPWQPGHYTIQIDSTLEDVAGNSLARRFETLEQEAIDSKMIAPSISIEWVVR